jgi:hypothetical protein
MLHNLHPNQAYVTGSFQQVMGPLGVALVVFRFGGKSFYLWKLKMQMFQEEKELWKIMSST